jgi:hypothetical protein
VPTRKRIQAHVSRIGVHGDYPGEMVLLMLRMSDLLCPQVVSLLTAAKSVSQQKQGQNASRSSQQVHQRRVATLDLCV